MLQVGSRVRVVRGARKGQEDVISEVQNGIYILRGDASPYSSSQLQEIADPS